MSLISPNFDVKSIIFPTFGQGPIPKIAGKSPASTDQVLTAVFHYFCVDNVCPLEIS